MRKKKSVKINYFYNLIYNLLTLLLPLLTTPYLSRVLRVENIGIYGFTNSIVTYFVLFGCLGTTLYGQREIAYVQDDKEKQSKVFYEIFFVKLISMFISILLYGFSFCLDGTLSLYYQILLIYLVANVFDISWYLQGIEEFDKTVIRNLIVKVLSIILIFVLVKKPDDLWIYFTIFAGSELLGNITMWIYVPKYLNKPNFKKLNLKKHLKPILMLFIPQIAIKVYTVLDKTMIGVISGNMNDVGFYEQGQNIVRALIVIITAYGTVMASRIAYTYKNSDKKKTIKYLKSSFRFSWLLGIPLMLGTIAVADKLVPWFFGDGYDPVSNIIKFTSPLIIAIGLNNVLGMQYLVPIGRQKDFTTAVVIGALSNFVLNNILIRLFGTIGAVIASVLAETIILIYELYVTRKEFNWLMIFNGIFKYLIAGIIMFIVIYNIELHLGVSLLNTFIVFIIGVITYFIMLLLLRDSYILDNLNILLKKVKR